jgi:hypothetical protein
VEGVAGADGVDGAEGVDGADGVDGVVVPGVVVFGVVVFGVVVFAFGRATPIPIMPFIPFAACPATLERYSYVPRVVKVKVRLADRPGASVFVPLPRQLFTSAPSSGALHTLNACGTVPLFATLNTTADVRDAAFHGRFDAFDSVNAYSVGFPAVTVTTVGATRRCRPAEGAVNAADSAAAAATATSTRPSPTARRRALLDTCISLTSLGRAPEFSRT